jgi:hypothetical protein
MAPVIHMIKKMSVYPRNNDMMNLMSARISSKISILFVANSLNQITTSVQLSDTDDLGVSGGFFV